MRFSSLVAFAAGIAAAQAQVKGFNYGSTLTDGTPKQQSDFEAEFNRAKSLQGASCFTSARIYTMIQGGTANTPISAIPAAVATKTRLLLGLWASAGEAVFQNELQALASAIDQYGSDFTDLIDGISVGSEDLYRITPTGIENKSGVGADPDTIVDYINQLRDAIRGTPASGAAVGHVDTWTAWVNSSNDAVISAVDWIGMDAYPYFQTTMENGIDNGRNLFYNALDATKGNSQGKDVWVCETGWPVSGPTENQAVASTDNAKTYWDEVACSLLGSVNTWWYTLQDATPDTPSPSFGIVGSDLNSAPLYDLTCPAGSSGAGACSGNSSSSSSSKSSSVASATAPGKTATSATASLETTPNVESTAAASGSAGSSEASSAAPAPSSGGESGGPQTITTRVTSYSTVTSCAGGCETSTLTLKSGDTYVVPGNSCPETESTPAPSSVTYGTAPPPPASSSATTPAAPSGSSCPTNLNGEYQYPHLIVPVSKSNPDKEYGTSYNGTISPDVSSIFNFDIPSSYSGRTCSLVMLFPEASELETSAYEFNGQGGISVTQLSSPATEQTTYSSAGSGDSVGSIPSLQSGNGYVVTSGSCPAGTTVTYEFSSTGGLDLNFFEDYNPSPLGAYITVC